MEDSVYKVCNQLITNTHVIGITIDCKYFTNFGYEVSKNDQIIELCVVSKEIGNHKTMYMDNGYLINIHWYTQEIFQELVKESHGYASDKKILFDRTGFIKRLFNSEIHT